MGMSGGGLAALALILAGPVLNLLPYQAQTLTDRASVWAIASCTALVWLAISIARMARHRFIDPRDTEPVGSEQTPRAFALSQQLQNTLEQAALAVGAYSVWIVLSPASWGVMPIAGAILFSLGRFLFFVGYSGGAGKRALGFAITFYPTIAILGCSMLAIFVDSST